MEKYSQFRDRGSGISPFIPINTPTTTFSTLVHAAIFLFRLPVFLTYCAFYFLFLTPLPLPQFLRKLLLWGMLGIPGIWWVDLQLDGVKRGSLSAQPSSRFPRARSIIAAQFTSPIDALYLSAIFDPVFTVSYPGTQKVQRISLLRAMTLALAPPPQLPPRKTPKAKADLTTLRALVEKYPHRVIAVFPEMTTTNGKGILPLAPSLLSAPPDVQIFPISMRYTPADITTPVPGAYGGFLWNLLSRPTHLIRVRIAEAVLNTSAAAANGGVGDGYGVDVTGERGVGGVQEEEEEEEEEETDDEDGEEEDLTAEEKQVLDRIGEALARLARNKRVGLTLKDKVGFIEAWNKGKK
ncbi:acyltransferase-like protein [Whalleya microplaca]|nr:acyltransferase-like protein [Whalleya microplaca]